MTETNQDPTNFLLLGDFAEDAEALDEEAFRAQHAEAFLLHHGPLHKLNLQIGLGNTLNNEGEQTRPDVPFNPREDFLVFPVRRQKPPTEEDDLIWLGRSEDNDVVIPDASVSAVHAMLKQDDRGEFFLLDMNSMNGTFVNDKQVPAQGAGDARPCESGARLRFGSVDMTILDAAEFISLVKHLLS